MKKVMVAMSGGVDSTVAAILLQNQGYEVIGATLDLLSGDKKNTALSDAVKMAAKLGIPHYVFDLSDMFKEEVISYFVDSYMNGKTPNPCIVCNSKIKFGKLLELAKELECDYLATGHYALIEEKDQRFMLKKGLDSKKDQSYVLYTLTQQQLSHILFPLGSMSKNEIRELA